ncbi:MAG TPA: hypothetical protein VJ461_01705 [Candidatus Nanoarchaeia archaeon]|nr:hypothetical protein [Candidatus Nanoarchaeia archaeon]
MELRGSTPVSSFLIRPYITTAVVLTPIIIQKRVTIENPSTIINNSI